MTHKQNTTADRAETKRLNVSTNLVGSKTLGNKDAFFFPIQQSENCVKRIVLVTLSASAAYLSNSTLKSLVAEAHGSFIKLSY